jgi:hypothetical protein
LFGATEISGKAAMCGFATWHRSTDEVEWSICLRYFLFQAKKVFWNNPVPVYKNWPQRAVRMKEADRSRMSQSSS